MKKIEDKINSSKMLHYNRTQDFDQVKNILNKAVKKEVNYLFNKVCEDTSILDKTKFGKKENFYTLQKASSDLLKHGPIKNEEGNYKYIKVLDIRKNENFGGLYMFLRRPSPLSLKVRTKIAELYLLPKKEIFAISKKNSNIWRKIHKKDFHNMVSIKHKTFKVLNKYIEINGLGIINPEEISRNYVLDENEKNKNSNNNSFFENKKQNAIIQNNSRNNLSSKSIVKNSNFIPISNSSKSQNVTFKKTSQKLEQKLNLSQTGDGEKLENFINNKSNKSIFYLSQKENNYTIKMKSENINNENENKLQQRKEGVDSEKINQTFIKKKTHELKEDMKKTKKKQKRKKLFSFAKEVTEFFKNKNFTIIFGNNSNYYFDIKNNGHLSSRTINQFIESEGVNSFISKIKNKSFLEGIVQMSSEEEKSFHHFNKKNISPQSIISFKYEPLYKNINEFTNLKYSQDINYQEKTLSFLKKLIKFNYSSKKDDSFYKSINSRSLSISSNLHNISNIDKKDN